MAAASSRLPPKHWGAGAFASGEGARRGSGLAPHGDGPAPAIADDFQVVRRRSGPDSQQQQKCAGKSSEETREVHAEAEQIARRVARGGACAKNGGRAGAAKKSLSFRLKRRRASGRSVVEKPLIFLGSAQALVAESEESAEKFGDGILGMSGDEFEGFGEKALGLRGREAEVEDGEAGVGFFVVVFAGAVFLDAELDVFVMELKIGFDDPVVAVGADALEEKSVGPAAPLTSGVEAALGAGDSVVNEGVAPGEADAAEAGVAGEKLSVGEVGLAEEGWFHRRRDEIGRAHV